MNRKIFFAFTILLICFSLNFLTACNKNNSGAASASSPATPATPIDPATVASISGTVRIIGTALAMSPIDMSNDPACKGTNQAETIVAHGDKLANVFVYIKNGFNHGMFVSITDPVIIHQSGCRYQPHVAGIMAGETLEIRNDDPTEHNIHAIGMQNDQWNESQMPKASPIYKKFDHPEIMLPLKCNQHPWMKMYVNVVANPFYAVTDADGKFAIKGLPPGEYTVAFVQEKLGEQDQKITLGAKGNKTLDVSFKGQ